jgi:hypothetical protein
MKKVLLASAVLTAASGMVANAQLSENFNSGIPSTWIMLKNDNFIPSANLNAAIVSKLTTQAWMAWPRAVGDSCALTTSYFTSPAKADRWLITPAFQVNDPNMVLSWEDYSSDASYPDSIQVLVSPTAGTTAASFTATLYNAKGTVGGFAKKGVSLGAYNGQTIRIAFRNNSVDQYVLRLDNVATAVVPAVDGAVDSVAFPRLASAGSAVKVLVSNQGATTLNSATITYSVDGGTPVSQTFTGLNLVPFASTWVQFSTTVNAAAGGHTLAVNLTQSNGAADPLTTNNSKSASFAVPNSSVTRNGLMEEFTSSTCAPCASFNATFDPLILANNANSQASRFNIIKFQMNWPTPNNDASYNADGDARRAFYGVTGIPDHYTNGMPGGAGDQAEIDNSKTSPAYMSITGRYTIKGDSMIATVTITPTFTLNNANFKLYMAATEKNYTNNAATTTQKQYYHVMRKMLPDGNGITINNFANGVPQTFTQRFKYTVGTVTQNSYNFWAHPFPGNLIAYVQDPASKEVIQSMAFYAQWPTDVDNVTENLSGIKVYPNPAKDMATVAFEAAKNTSVTIQVLDATGRAVYSIAEKANAGTQQVSIPTGTFAAGNYNVVVTSEEAKISTGLTVIK